MTVAYNDQYFAETSMNNKTQARHSFFSMTQKNGPVRILVCILILAAMVLSGCTKSGAVPESNTAGEANGVTTGAVADDTQGNNTTTTATGDTQGNDASPHSSDDTQGSEASAQAASDTPGNDAVQTADTGEKKTPADIPDMSAYAVKPASGNYIELALNVYYNDADTSYFSNESGNKPIFVTGEGQYALEFDCGTDLSAEAVTAGVRSLKNLTAIYITDMEHIRGEGQSALTACDIIYDRVIVNDSELTVNMTSPKAAFKSNGIFDTNDPVNSWDGSCVVEVTAAEHVANFTTVADPTRVIVVFTLSGMKWGGDEPEDTAAVGVPAVEGANTAVFSNMDLTGMNAIELSYYMGNGINLGNTFEATSSGKNASVSTYERAWGQPLTTEAMIKGYKAAGFDTLRIPVAWTNTMDFMKDDFEINQDYLERVAQVVQWALDAEMFVVLNDHWDSGWWAMFGSSDPATVEKAWKIYTEMWTRVSTYFRNYSDMLIFESANEELGNNLNNNGSWPDSGSLTADKQYKLTHDINQKFVDIVRNTGGNNDDRFLLIAGYNTDINDTCDRRYVMPDDTAQGKLFLSVHYYTPWNYCGTGPDGIEAKWGIKADYETMDKYLGMLKKFSDMGYGIIIGEYGALPIYDSVAKTNRTQNNTVEFTNYFLDHCDINNWVPLLWDTNGTYDKELCGIRDPEVAKIFSSRNFEKEKAEGEKYLENVKANMKAAADAAPAMWSGVETYEAGTPVAWIMWNGGAGTYSVGDVFNPADNTAGITANNAIVEKPGAYTVSLDFAKGNDGVTFAALAIADAELLYPKCYIVIDSITADGKELELTATPYTTSDDGKCTRVNLINEWVKTPPPDARTLMGPLSNASSVVLDKTQLVGIKNITIKFTLAVLH